MKAPEVSQILSAMGIANFFDPCNPDYTVHITTTGVMLDANDIDGLWTVIPMDRSERLAVWPTFNSEDELVALFRLA